ncbi:MAG: outer membrane protein assembly factor BamD [Chlorobium sp.]
MPGYRFFSRSALTIFAIGVLLSSGCSSSKPENAQNSLVNEGCASAVKLYEKKDYQTAIFKLESLMFPARATALEDDVLYLLGQSYYHSGDYMLAADMFSRVHQLSSTPYARTSQFMVAKSYEQLSPHFELDQQDTRKSIEQFSLYQELYPVSDTSKVASDVKTWKELLKLNPENISYKQSYALASAQYSRIDSLKYSEKAIRTMREKLAKNSFFIARQYVKLGKYKAAGIFYDEVITHYPDTIYDQPALEGKIDVLIIRKKWFDAGMALDQYLQLFPEKKKQMQGLRDTITQNCKN